MYQNYNFFKKFLFSLPQAMLTCCLAALLGILLSFQPGIPSARTTDAKSRQPSFQKTYSSLTVGQNATLSVKYLPKKGQVRFFSSNPEVAAIQKKNGKIAAKNIGTAIIYAKIWNQNGRVTHKLQMSLSVQPKDHFIKNAVFTLKQTINPYDYTIRLSSSRILLKKEMKGSVLSLIPEGRTEPLLSAGFSSLSSDGKEAEYLLTPDSQKLLCPGDSSMNGAYVIRSNSFPYPLAANYAERLDTNTISGFVLDIDGNPLADTCLSCQTTASASTACTDQTGYYKIKVTGKPLSLSAKKEGYEPELLTDLTVSSQGIICETIILKPETEDVSYSMDFLVTDEKKTPIEDAELYLIAKPAITTKTSGKRSREQFPTDQILFSAKTDNKGQLLLSGHEPHACKCSHITISKGQKLTLQSSYTPPAAQKYPLPEAFSPKEEYILFVFKESTDGRPSYAPRSVSFSPADFYTRHLSFTIRLDTQKQLDSSHLSLHIPESFDMQRLSHLRFSLYKPGEKNAIYEFPSSVPEALPGAENIFLSKLPVSLLDGTYHLRVTGLDERKNEILTTPVSEIEVFDSTISPCTFSFFPISYSRFFVYYAKEHKPEQRITAELYQKSGEEFFYLDTLTSSPFTGRSSDLFTADMLIPSLLPSQTYLFLPTKENLRLSSYLISDLSPEQLHDTKAQALASPPFLQCSCIFSSSPSPVPKEFLQKQTVLFPEDPVTLTKEQIRSADSYPNTVIVLYKKDGTFISTTLSPKLDKHTVFSKNSPALIDIYTNHELLLTNQASYGA